MKRILLLEGSPCRIITNSFSDPEELGIAMLAMNQITKRVLENFIKEFNLNGEENAIAQEWKRDLQKESKRQMKLQRISEKKLRREQHKKQKEYAEKRQEWLKKHLNNGEDNGVETEVKESTEKKTEYDENKDSEMANHSYKLKQYSRKSEETLAKDQFREKTDNCFAEKQLAKDQLNLSITEKTDNCFVGKQLAKDQLQLSSAEKTDYFAEKQFQLESKQEENLEKILTEDSFFITETGRTYLSTAVNSTVRDENAENIHTITEPNSFKKANTSLQKSVDRGSYNKKLVFREHENKKFIFERKHPSWEAKEKVRPVIKKFQGTKIRFDETDIKKQDTRSIPNDVGIDTKTMTKREITGQDKHPSWVAKQKMRPTIQAFQGTKIRFDTNDVD